MTEPRLALYWRCYGCHYAFTIHQPYDIGAVCCPCCGMTLLLPTHGPTDPWTEEDLAEAEACQ